MGCYFGLFDQVLILSFSPPCTYFHEISGRAGGGEGWECGDVKIKLHVVRIIEGAITHVKNEANSFEWGQPQISGENSFFDAL